MTHGRFRDVFPFATPALLLLALLAVPLAGLVWAALRGDLVEQLLDPAAHAAIQLSLLTTAVSMVVIIGLGTPLAYVLARWAFPGRTLVQLLVDLPIVLPPMVAGIAMLEVFGRNGWFGAPLGLLGINLPFSTAAVVMSQVFVAGPFYVRAARVGFSAIEPMVREAAYVEGANEWALFRHVMVPLSRNAIATGLVLSWARALGEFGATIFFAGNREGVTQTMPLAIFIGFESNLGIAVGLSFVLLVSSAAVLLLVRLIGGEESL